MTRALVACNPTGSQLEPLQIGARPHAGFVAQLIATVNSAPQTRARRRVEPAEAATAYRATGPATIRSCLGFTRSL